MGKRRRNRMLRTGKRSRNDTFNGELGTGTWDETSNLGALGPSFVAGKSSGSSVVERDGFCWCGSQALAGEKTCYHHQNK